MHTERYSKITVICNRGTCLTSNVTSVTKVRSASALFLCRYVAPLVRVISGTFFTDRMTKPTVSKH